MSERVETRDFMSVDSFSQLPFIRPSSNNNNNNNNNIRLFGFDLPPDHNNPLSSSSSSKDNNPSEEDGANPTAAESATAPAAAGGGGSDQSGRKFECHYCCRNFPTSQALGGHQNAHKRERQHAKRAHLQSVMAAASHHPPPIAEGHVYRILNYHRLGGSPGSPSAAAAARFGGLDPPPHYPSWSNNYSTGAAGGGPPRFYSGPGSASQPINGSPLPAGLWGVPGGAMGMVLQQQQQQQQQRDSHSLALPNLLGGSVESRTTLPMGMGGNSYNIVPSSAASSSSPSSRPYDGVSLDLHL